MPTVNRVVLPSTLPSSERSSADRYTKEEALANGVGALPPDAPFSAAVAEEHMLDVATALAKPGLAFLPAQKAAVASLQEKGWSSKAHLLGTATVYLAYALRREAIASRSESLQANNPPPPADATAAAKAHYSNWLKGAAEGRHARYGDNYAEYRARRSGGPAATTPRAPPPAGVDARSARPAPLPDPRPEDRTVLRELAARPCDVGDQRHVRPHGVLRQPNRQRLSAPRARRRIGEESLEEIRDRVVATFEELICNRAIL